MSEAIFEWAGELPAGRREYGDRRRHARVLSNIRKTKDQPGNWAIVCRYGSADKARNARVNIRRNAGSSRWIDRYELAVRERCLYARFIGDHQDG